MEIFVSYPSDIIRFLLIIYWYVQLFVIRSQWMTGFFDTGSLILVTLYNFNLRLCSCPIYIWNKSNVHTTESKTGLFVYCFYFYFSLQFHILVKLFQWCIVAQYTTHIDINFQVVFCPLIPQLRLHGIRSPSMEILGSSFCFLPLIYNFYDSDLVRIF